MLDIQISPSDKQQGTTGDRKMVLPGQWTWETLTQSQSNYVCINLHATTTTMQTEQKISAKTV